MLIDTDGFYAGLLSWLGTLAQTEFVRRPALELVTVVGTVGAALDVIDARLGATPS